jgi:secreted trypsin-like serine protease
MQNDVGLLYLAEAVDVPVAQLATDITGRLLLRARVAATILGWGKTESSAQPVDRLRVARIYLEEYSRAGTRYTYRYTAGPCARDSGSPMLMRTLDGRALVVGIATATDGNLCASGGGRAVYTSLYPVRDFIFEQVGSD